MKMTAYEEFKYDDGGEVTAVFPALPQTVWNAQVLEYVERLIELQRYYATAENEDPELDAKFFKGAHDATTRLTSDFLKIFDVKVEAAE
jgi:hypothetical protein